MALSNKDIEQIGLIMGKKLSEELEGIKDLVAKHNLTLFGPEGNNGLYGDVGTMRKRIGRLEKISYAAQTILAGLIAFKDKLFG